MDIRGVNLVYGASATGKTSWFVSLAKYIFETVGLRTRFYVGDAGRETIDAEGLVEASIAEVMVYNNWPHPFETSAKICEGYWPEDPNVPGSKLLPLTNAQRSSIGLYVYEGLNTMCEYMMGETEGGLAWQMAQGKALNNDDSFRFTDGTEKVGGNARTHYNVTQNRILQNIRRTSALVGMKGWTAHERAAEDARELIIGPATIGGKQVSTIGKEFAHTTHLVSVPVKKPHKDPLTGKSVDLYTIEYRAYLRQHYDPSGATFARYYANTRIPRGVLEADPEFLPEYLAPADPLAFHALLAEAKQRTQSK